MLVRKGDCKRCGACCVLAVKAAALDSRELREWAEVRRIQVLDGEEGEAVLMVKSPCPHLEFGLIGQASCKLQENKPLRCRKFPAGPEDLLAGCGFYFGEAG